MLIKQLGDSNSILPGEKLNQELHWPATASDQQPGFNYSVLIMALLPNSLSLSLDHHNEAWSNPIELQWNQGLNLWPYNRNRDATRILLYCDLGNVLAGLLEVFRAKVWGLPTSQPCSVSVLNIDCDTKTAVQSRIVLEQRKLFSYTMSVSFPMFCIVLSIEHAIWCRDPILSVFTHGSF